MRKLHRASGGKTVKLGRANMLQVSFTRLSALPRVRGQWTDAGRSAHRSPWERFASPGSPSTCAKTPKYRNPSFPKNLVKRVQHARARVLNPDFSTTPYTSRMREQYSTSRGKAVKLGPTNMLQVGSTRLSASPCVQGERADAGRSAHSLSVGWQAWGTKGGLCWRAPRDGVRHMPAGPPKSLETGNQPRFEPRGASQPPVPRRFPARTRIVFAQQPRTSISTKKTREINSKNEICVLCRAPSAGAGKNALFPSRSFSARGALGVAVGVGFGVGVRTPDSHALSNTWESVQESGLLESC